MGGDHETKHPRRVIKSLKAWYFRPSLVEPYGALSASSPLYTELYDVFGGTPNVFRAIELTRQQHLSCPLNSIDISIIGLHSFVNQRRIIDLQR